MKTINIKEWYRFSDKEKGSFTGIVDDTDFSIYYFKNGKLHREDGPAFESVTGHKEWCIEGKLHNLQGPAIIRPDNKKEYFLYDKQYTKKEYYQLVDLLKYKELI